MIEIDFAPPDEDERWQRWRQDCDRATRELCAAVEQGEAIVIDDALYRRPCIKQAYYVAGDGPFRGRCAYCESSLQR